MLANRVMLTGATGFIGSRLTMAMLEKGWHVSAIRRPESKMDYLNGIDKEISFHSYDGSIDSLAKAMVQEKPDIVIHLASLFIARHQALDIVPLVESNITFGTRLAEVMANNKVYKLINTGTSWQHFSSENYNPVCLYAATKQAFDDILRYYHEAGGLNVVTLKLFDTYGPGDKRRKLLNLLKRVATTGEHLDMSPGLQRINLVHIDDVVSAFIQSINIVRSMPRGFQDFAVRSGEELTLQELVSKVELITGQRLNITFGAIPYREREEMQPWGGGKSLPQWSPKIRLDEGLKTFFQNL